MKYSGVRNLTSSFIVLGGFDIAYFFFFLILSIFHYFLVQLTSKFSRYCCAEYIFFVPCIMLVSRVQICVSVYITMFCIEVKTLPVLIICQHRRDLV